MADETTEQQSSEILPVLSGFGDVKVEVTAILGTTQIPIEQFLKLSRGAIIELEQSRDAPVTMLVNGYAFAEGEIRVNNDKVACSVLRLIDHSRDLE